MDSSHTNPEPGRLLRATRVAAVLLLIAFCAHAGFWHGKGLDTFFGDWVYNALVVCAAAWCLTRAVRVREQRGAWLLLGCALGLWAAAELTNTLYLSSLANPPYPSIADAMWIGFYPASLAGLLLLVRGRVTGPRRTTLWIDGLVAALAVAAVGEVALVQPVIDSSGGSGLALATNIAYPLGDLMLLSIVVGVIAMTGWRPGRTWAMIGAGLAAAVVADSIYAFQAAQDTYVDGTLLDALWPAATLLVGHAAWEPSGRPIEVRPSGWRVFVLPAVFACTALALLVYDHYVHMDDLAVVLAGCTLIAVIVRTALTFRENLQMLAYSRHEALTDPLTGLGNRRRLMTDLLREIDDATEAAPRALILFDLDGFKRYNDSFGHPAGDSLLARLGRNLAVATDPWGRAYRLGGDEFCALVAAGPDQGEHVLAAALAALTEHGRGFVVRASHGMVFLPKEAGDPSQAMQVADQRLYGSKGARRRSSVGQQTRDVLLQVLRERQPTLHAQMHEVAQLAVAVGREIALAPEALEEMARAAELHDVGKMAVPEEILNKRGPLDPVELAFIRQHTIIGERILRAAPALAPVARLVRSSHENWDGSGYPDGIRGDEIPLASRIIAACDAFNAMTRDRPYVAAMSREAAIAELRRCAGTHFDPEVVDVLCALLEAGPIAVELPPESVPYLGPPSDDDLGDPTPLDPELAGGLGELLREPDSQL
jgi:diguanylate cyclase (GGDEF)-like protein